MSGRAGESPLSPLSYLMKKQNITTCALAVVALTSIGLCQTAGKQNGTNPGSMVDWLVPTPPSNRPQTPVEEEAGKQQGRRLPAPELLQPTLDPTLRDYQPLRSALSGSYKAAASDVLPGLVKQWIAAFRKYYPGVNIDLSPPYAGSLGAQELVRGDLDLAFVSRELRPEDVSAFKARFAYDPFTVPICGGSYRHFGFLDAVAFFINKENPLEKLSFDQLDGILSSTNWRGGKSLVTWGDLGLTGEWAAKPIHVYGVRPWNGFEEFVRQRVLSVAGKRGEWRDGISFEKVVFPIATHVANDRYGIGYSGVAYIDAGVKVLPLAKSNADGYYTPTYENVASAKYPLSRLIYVNMNVAPRKPLPPALKEFLTFILSKQGQQIVLDQGIYLPLRSWQSESSLSLVQR